MPNAFSGRFAGAIDGFRERETVWPKLIVLLVGVGLVLAGQTSTGIGEPGGALNRFVRMKFVGLGSDSIRAMVSDRRGNLYVAGRTSSPDLPVRGAAQPEVGDWLLARSSDLGVSWQAMAGPPAGTVLMRADPMSGQTLWAIAADGVFKSGDGGKSWKQKHKWPVRIAQFSELQEFDLRIDPGNSSRIYIEVMRSPSLFLASIDGGEEWMSYVASYPMGARLQSFWVDPNGSGAVVAGEKISWDQGATWRPFRPPESESGASSSTRTWPVPGRPGWVYGVTDGAASESVYLSKDWGMSWSARTRPRSDQTMGEIEEIVFDPALPNAAYVRIGAGAGWQVSEDEGRTWRQTGDSGWIQPEKLLVVSSRTGPTQLVRHCGAGGAITFSGFSLKMGELGAAAQDTLQRVSDVSIGPDCAVYAARQMSSDAFVAKIASDGGDVVWATYLGGSEADGATGIAVDDLGNVYVAGDTASADFPATAERSGPGGKQGVFITKLDSAGGIVYSATYGGEGVNAATALSVGADYEVYVAGVTSSKLLPATPGAFETRAGQSGDGFAIKLSWDGKTSYITYLPKFAAYAGSSAYTTRPPETVAVVAEAAGTALVGGAEGIFGRLSADGSQMTTLATLPGQVSEMRTGADGSVYVAGHMIRGALSTTCSTQSGSTMGVEQPRGDVYVVKLRPESLAPEFQRQISGACQSWPTDLSIGGDGEINLATKGSVLPARNPVLVSSDCMAMRLSSDGSKLIFSTGLDMCGAPVRVAQGLGGTFYASVSRSHAGVLSLPVLEAGSFSVEQAANAFRGPVAMVSPGMLFTIEGEDLAPEFIDLGLNYAGQLPRELGGVRVLFSGVAAEVLQVAPERIICVVPEGVFEGNRAWVQVERGDVASTPFVIGVTSGAFVGVPGYMTHWFPKLPPAGTVDGSIQNADGMLNGRDHPAAPGSTVILFATGFREPGAVSLAWNAPPQSNEALRTLPPSRVYRMPGFIDALFAVEFRIPDGPGPGVYAVPVAGVLTRFAIGRTDSGLGVWVK